MYLSTIMRPHTGNEWIGSMSAVKEDFECQVNFFRRIWKPLNLEGFMLLNVMKFKNKSYFIVCQAVLLFFGSILLHDSCE